MALASKVGYTVRCHCCMERFYNWEAPMHLRPGIKWSAPLRSKHNCFSEAELIAAGWRRDDGKILTLRGGVVL